MSFYYAAQRKPDTHLYFLTIIVNRTIVPRGKCPIKRLHCFSNDIVVLPGTKLISNEGCKFLVQTKEFVTLFKYFKFDLQIILPKMPLLCPYSCILFSATNCFPSVKGNLKVSLHY